MDNSNPFPGPAPDFSDPLGLLRACHQRVIDHCNTLERMSKHLVAKGLDEEVRQAATAIHRYFSRAGRHHHEDEEQDFFPALAHSSPKLTDRIHRLRGEHEVLNGLWDKLAPQLQHPNAIEDVAAFTALATRFAETQREHVRQENEELLDVALHTFSSDELKTLGEAMAARRGVQPR